jgi:hypothetical protein
MGGFMKQLISGQSVKCDIHDAGSKQSVEWGKGLHIHKRMYGKSYGSAQVIIPLDEDKKLKIDARGSAKIKKELFNEIKRAFSDVQKRTEFVEGLISEIGRFSNGLKVKAHCRSAAKRIAKHFQLDETIERDFIKKMDSEIIRYTSIHSGRDNKLYYISQSPGKIIASEIRTKK